MTSPSFPLRRVLLGALLVFGLAACSEPPPPPIQMVSTEGVDVEVLRVVQRTLAQVDASPDDADLRAELALVYEANQLWHEANLAWEQTLLMRGADGRGVEVYHRALCARQAGEIEDATALLQRAVALTPELAAAHYKLAETHLEVGELAEAEARFSAAARFAPTSSDPLVGLALVLLARDESAGAEVRAREALSIEPTLKRAHYALGLALRGLGRLDEAERELTLGLGSEARNLVDPLSARLVSLKTGYHARISEAVDHVAAGNPAAAVRLMEPILQTHPEDEVLLNNLAVAYTHLGRNEKAREVLLRIIAINETSFAAYINLTAAELELGMNAEAMRHGEAAVRYAPDVAKTRLVRARVYMAYGRWNEAYADLKKAVQIQGEDALHHLLLAEVCQKLNKHTEAVKEFEVALRLDQRMQYAWLELGFSAALLGDFQKAAQAYEKAKLREGAAHPRVVALGRLINGG